MNSVSSLLNALAKKQTSCAEVVQSFFATIQQKDKELNAFVDVDQESALKQATLIDQGRATPGHLTGVPYATKDNILVKGSLARAGSRMLENYRAPYNATVVKKLNKQNAVRLGTTNMDEFAMGSSTETSAFGVTKNPRDPSRVSGGSSGGSAVAVASGMVPFALGSDTGGSIRQPAAFCGVVGYKPSYGAVSRHGLIAMASSLDQIGTFTQTVEDAQIIAPLIMGKDKFDASSYSMDVAQHHDVKNLKIGVAPEHFSENLDKRINDSIQKALKAYKGMGATVQEIELPHAEYALAVYYILMPSEVSSNLARFDGLRYGFSEQGDNVKDQYLATRYKGFGREVKRRIMLGTYTLSSGYYDAYYKKAQQVRALIAQDYAKAFEKVDVIISPTTPTPAFKIGEKTTDPLTMYLEDIYTVGVNLAGLPAISIPTDPVEEDGKQLPVGMHLIAPQQQDAKLLAVARMWEEGKE